MAGFLEGKAVVITGSGAGINNMIEKTYDFTDQVVRLASASTDRQRLPYLRSSCPRFAEFPRFPGAEFVGRPLTTLLSKTTHPTRPKTSGGTSVS